MNSGERAARNSRWSGGLAHALPDSFWSETLQIESYGVDLFTLDCSAKSPSHFPHRYSLLAYFCTILASKYLNHLHYSHLVARIFD